MVEEKCIEEGPCGKNNARFLLRKSTVLDHFKIPKPHPPLIIDGHAYDLRGIIGGQTGQKFNENSSIQWLEFRNHAASLPRLCEHWSYFLQAELILDINAESPTFGQLLNFDTNDVVNLELHKKPLCDTEPICSSSTTPASSDVGSFEDRKTTTLPLDDSRDGLLVPLLIQNHLKSINYRSIT